MARDRGPPLPPPPNPSSSFRDVERFWKARRGETAPPLAFAFDPFAVEWSASPSPGSPRRGVWTNAVTGEEVECWRVPLEETSACGMGQSWKGKAKELEEDDERDWGIVIPTMPGLVLLPAILPPTLQRALTIESLRHSVLPNLTSLSAHYALPVDGLWTAWTSGRGDEKVPRLDYGKPVEVARRERVDFEPVTEDNYREVKGRGEGRKGVNGGQQPVEVKEVESTVAKLLNEKLRWTTIGYSYDWTSKTYDFDRTPVPLPPLIEECCRAAVRAVPWKHVFPEDIREDEDPVGSTGAIDKTNWRTWAEGYAPESGIINFYHLKDSLTAHVDQSEVDGVRPLVSFSIGHSSVFLVGGPTRDTAPLSILLRSGDGILMSGPQGRRVFHGLPRVLEGTLPEYLSSTHADATPEWEPFGQYLGLGARININVREVF